MPGNAQRYIKVVADPVGQGYMPPLPEFGGIGT